MVNTTNNDQIKEEGTYEPLKDYVAFESRIGICYVPENGDSQYTYKDILDIAEGDEKVAQNIFDVLEWQHPETVKLEIDQDTDEDEDDYENDLFQYPELVPKNVSKELDKLGTDPDYDTLARVLKAIEKLGYTYDYYLDANPFNLRKKS